MMPKLTSRLEYSFTKLVCTELISWCRYMNRAWEKKLSYMNKWHWTAFCSVAYCWVDQEWYVDFWRTLSAGEFEEWESLLRLLQQVSLDDECIDSVIWVLDKKGQFSTKSLYRFLSDRGFWRGYHSFGCTSWFSNRHARSNDPGSNASTQFRGELVLKRSFSYFWE